MCCTVFQRFFCLFYPILGFFFLCFCAWVTLDADIEIWPDVKCGGYICKVKLSGARISLVDTSWINRFNLNYLITRLNIFKKLLLKSLMIWNKLSHQSQNVEKQLLKILQNEKIGPPTPHSRGKFEFNFNLLLKEFQ